MACYRRARIPGGTWFFTVVTAGRCRWLGTAEGVETFRECYRQVRREQPFETIAMVILPDHLHCIWRLPEEDSDFPRRWQRIKRRTTETMRSRGRSGPFWQARYWEHLIRDEADLQAHMDYVHYNPVRHGYVDRAADWEPSSLHRYMRMGWYAVDWGVSDAEALDRLVLSPGGDP